MSYSWWYLRSTYDFWWKEKDAIWIYRRFQIEGDIEDDIENRSFAVENISSGGRSLKSFQNISPKNVISRDSLNSLVQKVTETIYKKQFSNKKEALWIYTLPVYFTLRN